MGLRRKRRRFFFLFLMRKRDAKERKEWRSHQTKVLLLLLLLLPASFSVFPSSSFFLEMRKWALGSPRRGCVGQAGLLFHHRQEKDKVLVYFFSKNAPRVTDPKSSILLLYKLNYGATNEF